MFGLNNFRRFIQSFQHAIGVDDPDLQHGRIGREDADRKSLHRAGSRIKASRYIAQPHA